jgi:hypothetical protein
MILPTYPRLVPLHGAPARERRILVVVACSTLVGRPGLHQSGLMSTCFADCPSPGPRKNDLTIYWALGPFVRSFTLPVDPGDICPPHRGTQFTSKFWMSLQQAMGTKLYFSTAYHPQSDGQTERVNKVLEDLLRACVLTFDRNWESSLPYTEFSSNNSYQASIKMSPFEALYGRKCQTPLMWSNVGERTLEGPAFIKEAETKVALNHKRLLEAQSRQKSYADNRRRELSFEEGDFVYLKVSPMRGVKRFQVKGKLAPRFVGPYPIIGRIGPVAYRLQLPESISDIHNVFHVSQLRKCLKVLESHLAEKTVQI